MNFLAETHSNLQPFGVIFNPLAVLTWAPILAGIILLCCKSLSDDVVKKSAIGFTLVLFVMSVVMGFCFDWSSGAAQFAGSADWIAGLGVKYSFGADTISFSLILLTTFLFPLTLLGAFGDVKSRVREFTMWMLVLQGALIGSFAATDLAFFFIFFELTLIPLYFLIGIFGGPQKRWAAVKLFIFTLSGSVFTLAGILYVGWFTSTQNGGVWTFDIATITSHATKMPAGAQFWVLMAFLVGFAVKVPLFPVHTWLPLAHTEAPTSGSVMLAGVLLKLGTYGLLRFAIPFAPAAAAEYAWFVGILAVAGIIYAALICWVQSDIKKLVAYSSVSHLGFCVLGLFALNVEGIGGSVMYMINHGLSTGALFLCVGMVYERYHTRDMDSLSGLGKRLPVWSFFMVYFCFASVGLPGLNGFIGEFLTMFGAFIAKDTLGIAFVVPAALGLILGAIYILYMVGKVVMGPVVVPEKYDAEVKDLNFREISVLTPLAVLCLVLGLYPTPLLKSLEPSINQTTVGVQEVLKLNELKAKDQNANLLLIDGASTPVTAKEGLK